jgi:hypothetical protein
MDNLLIWHTVFALVIYVIGVLVGRYSYKMEIDFPKLAKRIAEREGKKKSVNIAQINEILKITLEELKLDK